MSEICLWCRITCTEQWAFRVSTALSSANILVTTKKDFETANRKKFCARIATGDYDAVIIGHSQFERIPISRERQERLLREQIHEIHRWYCRRWNPAAENGSPSSSWNEPENLWRPARETTATEGRKDDVVTLSNWAWIGSLSMKRTIIKICFCTQKCGMWRASPPLTRRNPAICSQVPLHGRDHRQPWRYLCHRYTGFQLYDGAPVRGCNNLTLASNRARYQSGIIRTLSSPDLSKRGNPMGSVACRRARNTETSKVFAW